MSKLSLLTKFAVYKVNSLFREDELSDFILSQVQLGAVTKKLAQIKQTQVISKVNLEGAHRSEIRQEIEKAGYPVAFLDQTMRPGSMANVYFFTSGEKQFCYKRYHPDLGEKITKSINQLMTAGKFYAWKKDFDFDAEKFSLQLKSVLLGGLEGEEEARKTNLFRNAFPEIKIPQAFPLKNAVCFEFVNFVPAISRTDITSDEKKRIAGDLLSFMIESVIHLGQFHADLNFENWGLEKETRKLAILDFGETISTPTAFKEFIQNLRQDKVDLKSIGYTHSKDSGLGKFDLEIALIVFAPFLASENFYVSTWNPQDRLKELLKDDYITLREHSPSWILFYLRSMFFILKFCEQEQITILTLKTTRPPETQNQILKKRLHISVIKDGDEIVNVLFPPTVAFRLESVLDDDLLEKIKKTHDLSKIDENFSYEELNGNRKITIKFIDG